MSDIRHDPIDVAIQAVLHLANRLAVEPAVKYSALMMLADRFLPTATISLQNVSTSLIGSTNAGDSSMAVLAGAALYFTWKCKHHVRRDDEDRAVQFLSKTVAACNQCISSREESSISAKNLINAAELLRREVGSSHLTRRLVSDHVQEFHSKAQKASIRAFSDRVKVSDCLALIDALYGSAKFRGALGNGGKLLASGIIAAAYCIFVPRAEVVLLPFCAWLADISGHPKEVIEAQAESVMRSVLMED